MLSAISFLTKIKPKKIPVLIHRLIIVLSLIVIFVIGPYLFYNINFIGKIFPNIYVAGENVGGLSLEDASKLLSEKIVTFQEITLTSGNKSFVFKPSEFDITPDYSESVNRAYNLVRTDNFLLDNFERFKLIFRPHRIGINIDKDEYKIVDFINAVARQVDTNPIDPTIEVVDNTININKGSIGYKVDTVKLRAILGMNLSMRFTENIEIPVNKIDPTLDEKAFSKFLDRSKSFLGKSISLEFESKIYNLDDREIIKFISPYGGYNEPEIKKITDKISFDINIDPQTPKFDFDGTRVKEFAPAKDGVSVDTLNFESKLKSTLDDLEKIEQKSITFKIPTKTTKPPVSTEQVNNLGIKELIGSATSTYYHSIPGRVFNVNLAASRINGTLIPPGQTFSFNQTLGDVSKFTGYQQAYIISGGRTILGDGGGVCQVSTTLFRAALNAGLPINERSSHAYRVGYYEQNSPPGLDATVYYPTTDFKFTNDTQNYILIQAKNDSKNYTLVFDLYGTADGRISTISKPVISNYTPPLQTVYQDDPTLPSGTLKQVDYAAAGSKVSFKYTVTKNNEQLFQKNFVSNYQPWAAVYLRGTGNK